MFAPPPHSNEDSRSQPRSVVAFLYSNVHTVSRQPRNLYVSNECLLLYSNIFLEDKLPADTLFYRYLTSRFSDNVYRRQYLLRFIGPCELHLKEYFELRAKYMILDRNSSQFSLLVEQLSIADLSFEWALRMCLAILWIPQAHKGQWQTIHSSYYLH